MSYFVPDRSNRPTDEGDPSGGTTELYTDEEKTVELTDGRVAVVETALVDGFTLVYYYFDVAGLESASEKKLADLLKASGVEMESSDPEIEVVFSASKTDDAQGRKIWEAQLSFWG